MKWVVKSNDLIKKIKLKSKDLTKRLVISNDLIKKIKVKSKGLKNNPTIKIKSNELNSNNFLNFRN